VFTQLIVSISLAIISFLAFCVSIVSLRMAWTQKRLDNLVTLQSFLHRDDLSEARKAVREGTSNAGLNDPAIRRVCSSFDFAGMLVANGAVEKSYFLDYWYVPIITLSEPLETIANEYAGKGVTVRAYYKYAYWLIQESKKLAETRKFA
jgi:hypothetical protein